MEDIKQEITKRAEDFALHYDEEALRNSDIRMKAPMLFILLGDKVQDGLETIRKSVERRMSNSEGIVYLSVTSNEQDEENTERVHICLNRDWENNQGDKTSNKKSRGNWNQLFDSDAFLAMFNQKLAKLNQLILEKNKIFSYWEQIHVAVITEGDDEVNVILPDLMALLKNKLEQNFKQVFVDLFVLLEETNEVASAMNKAMAYSLFQELDLYQNKQYHYERATELIEEDLKLMTTHEGKLFHLVYMLSDKKENGQRIHEARKNHYESIVAVNFLKNREQKSVELEEVREQYSYNTFMSNIQVDAENRYATARLAKVRKPGQGIYLSVLYHLFRAYKNELSYEGEGVEQSLLDQVGLSEQRIESYIREWMPDSSALEEIRSIISTKVSFRELKGETFAEAENILYEKSVKAFFEANFQNVATHKMRQAISVERLKGQLTEAIVSGPHYGPFALSKFLQSDTNKMIEAQKEKYLYQMKQKQLEVEEKENQLVGEHVGGSFSLLDKKYLQDVKGYLIHEVYKARYDYVAEELKLKTVQRLQEEIEVFNQNLKEQVKKLEQVENLLLEMIEEANRYEEEYLIQNVKEYYEKVIVWQLEEMKKSKGEHFLQDEKYMGSSAKLLRMSKEEIIRKIMSIAEAEFLKEEQYFNLSFEEELLARANMHIEYTDTEVVAKTELYELLYDSLESNSKPCVYLDTTLAPYQYVEKYFISSQRSEFTAYAYKRDQSSCNYKISMVSDQRNSVIEKLQLMGGFKLQDLVYVRSAKRYYDAYKAQGYMFHSEIAEQVINKEEI